MPMFQFRALPGIAFACVILTAALFVQYGRLFEIQGVNPNLFLVFLVVLLFSHFGAARFIVAAVWSLLFVLLFEQLWIGRFVLLIALTALGGALRRMFTGNLLVDYCIGIAVISLVFSSVLSFTSSAPFSLFRVFAEALYNVLIGLIAL